MAQSLFVLGALGAWAASTQLRSATATTTAAPAAKAAPVAAAGQHVNKYGDVEDIGNLRTGDWARRWERSQIQWHRPKVNDTLLRQEERVFGSKKCTVLLPLCGKSVDLAYLYQKGHTVVGIEIVTQAVVDFFYDQSETFPSYTVSKVPGTSIYRYASLDGRLQIFQADIFSEHLTRELLLGAGSPGFEVVWDRASLVALNPHTRARYVASLTRLLAPKSQYLLMTLIYDQSLMHGPPFNTTDEAVHTLYAAFDRELVEDPVVPPMENGAGQPTVPCVMHVHLMVLKE